MRFSGLSLGWFFLLVGLMVPMNAGAEETATHSLGALSATEQDTMLQLFRKVTANLK